MILIFGNVDLRCEMDHTPRDRRRLEAQGHVVAEGGKQFAAAAVARTIA
jgi:hypothetical protein